MVGIGCTVEMRVSAVSGHTGLQTDYFVNWHEKVVYRADAGIMELRQDAFSVGAVRCSEVINVYVTHGRLR